MANYYTEASFIVPLTHAQATAALEALSIFHEDIDLNGDHKYLTGDGSNKGLSISQEIARRAFQAHPEQTPDFQFTEIFWGFFAEIYPENGLAVCHDECIDAEHACVFIQAVFQVFDLDTVVTFEEAYTCSKARIDAYGGGAWAVGKDFIRSENNDDFVLAEKDAAEKGTQYFYCGFIEVNGEYENRIKFLMKVHKGENADDKLRQNFIEHRASSEDEVTFDGDDFIYYPCGLAGKKPSKKAITPLQYRVLSDFLSTL